MSETTDEGGHECWTRSEPATNIVKALRFVPFATAAGENERSKMVTDSNNNLGMLHLSNSISCVAQIIANYRFVFVLCTRETFAK